MEKPEVINVLECEGCHVPKGWGEEIIICNHELYCGKLLRFKQGAKFSMHYHMIKDETWYVKMKLGMLMKVNLSIDGLIQKLLR